MEKSLGHKAVNGAVWATIDRFSYMGIQFTVNLILARLLLPSDFGIIGMLAIFISVSQTLIDGGFGSALIQKKNPTETDYSTIFFWNLGFSLILYLILYVAAIPIATFFSMPQLCPVLRIISLTLIISGILSIQRIRLQKELAFKKLAIVNLSAYFIGAVSAITMAKNGWGVWSLVFMQIIYYGCSVIVIWLITHWHPSLVFSPSSLKKLFGFGGFIMAASILQTVCQNVQGLIIGKKFSATQMGYFSQAYKLDQITSYTVPQIIVQVMYPVYSSFQDNKDELNKLVLMNMRVIAFIVFPILTTLIIIAEPLITFLYGAKWLPCVPYFQILCVAGFFVSLQNLNFYAVAAVGKSKSLFKWSFYKWGFLLGALLLGMHFGMYGILWGMVISSINIFLTNSYLSQQHTGLKVSNQLINLLPIIATLLVGISIGFTVGYFTRNLFFNASATIVSFTITARLINLKAFHDVLSIAKKIRARY